MAPGLFQSFLDYITEKHNLIYDATVLHLCEGPEAGGKKA